jgi:hypothetical protein
MTLSSVEMVLGGPNRQSDAASAACLGVEACQAGARSRLRFGNPDPTAQAAVPVVENIGILRLDTMPWLQKTCETESSAQSSGVQSSGAISLE